MIVEQTEIMKNKMLRGQILRALSLFYPSPVDVNGIKASLATRGMFVSADVLKPLHYLKDKGYVNVNEPNIMEIKDSNLVELTAKGIDLIEGTIDDPGVDI